jgi:outer membrane protein, multidrug efflux system
MSSAARRCAALAAPLILACGCATIVPPQLPDDVVPAAWQGPLDEDASVWPELQWWDGFRSPELTSLIEEVLDHNLDLANNERNLIAAQIALREAGFSLWPAPVLSLGTGTSYSRTDLDGASSSNNSSGPFQLTGAVSYGGILSRPAAYQRAVADYDSRIAQAAAVRLNTLGTAASTYFQILLIRDRIEVAEQNLENAEAVYSIARARVEAGVAVPIEELQQRIAVERERTNIDSLRQNELSARAALSLLVGTSVHGFDVGAQTLAEIVVPAVQPGLPSELLTRRPDLVQAEASLRGATANVKAVRTSFFPQISLTASNTATSPALANVLSGSTSIAIGASLMQTLLDNGQRRRNIAQARLSLETSLASYQRAVLAAFNEIEVQLSSIALLERQSRVALSNLEAAEESYRIAELRYNEGVTDYQTVVIAQNTLFSSRTSVLDNKLQRLNAMLNLYQALGGGWERPREAPEEASE